MDNNNKLELNSVEAIELSEIKTLLQELKDIKVADREKEEKRKKLGFIIQTITCALVAIMTIGVIALLPKVYSFAEDTSKMMADIDIILDEAGDAVVNLNKISSDLAQMDLPRLFEEVDALVDQSQKSVNKAVETIDKINIDDLNKSISALKMIVEPMSKLFMRNK